MRCTAIITGPETHLDHLGVLSSLLQIPLIVTDQKTYTLAKQYYPDLDVSLKGLDELSIGYLAENFDAIFETGKFWAAELKPFFELLFRKKMRFVFCPHGNSDKGHSLQNHVEQDISLVYGDHLSDLLKRTNAAEKIKHFVRTGNYRYPYYLKHRAFFDALAEEKVFCRFKNKKAHHPLRTDMAGQRKSYLFLFRYRYPDRTALFEFQPCDQTSSLLSRGSSRIRLLRHGAL